MAPGNGPLYIGPWQEYELSLILRQRKRQQQLPVDVAASQSSQRPSSSARSSASTRLQPRPQPRQAPQPREAGTGDRQRQRLQKMHLLYKRHLVQSRPEEASPVLSSAAGLRPASSGEEDLVEWSLGLDADALLAC